MNFCTFVTFVVAAVALMKSTTSLAMDWSSTSCKQTADVIFVVDTSSSIWPPYFNRNTKSFIKGIISNFNVGSGVNDSRIGLVLFSTRVYREFQLKDYSSMEDIEYHINRRMRYRGGNTNTHKALNYVASNMLKPENGRRDNVTTVVIVITDGGSDFPIKTKAATDFLKTKGVEVFAIGIGAARDEELRYMASDPDEDFVFHVRSFSSIGSIEKRFVNQTCTALKAAAATTTTTSTTTTTTTTPTTTTTTTTPTTTTTTTPTTTTTTPTTTTTTPTTTKTTTTEPTTTTPTTTTSSTTTATTTTEPTTTTTIKPITTTTSTTTTSPTTTVTSTTTSTITTTHETTTPRQTTSTSSTTTITTPEPKQASGEDVQRDQSVVEECQGKPADIYFLLDASSSVWIGHFHDRVLPFVRNLVKSFEISPMNTRVGLVTFSDDVDHVFSLAKHRNMKSLIRSLQPENVAYLTGGTNTGDAISFVTKHGLGEGASRKGVAKIIITVTDGMSQVPWRTTEAAQLARDQGIIMFAIGVGKQVDDAELSNIASDPDEDHVFTVESFKDLSSISISLARKTCSAVNKATVGGSDYDKKIDCSSKPLNVMFMYEYLNSAQNSKKVIDHVIHRFATQAAAYAPKSKLGVMTRPCVGSDIPLMDTNAFQISLEERRSNFFVSLADIVRQVRVNTFGSNHLNTEKKVAVIVLDEQVQNTPALRKEVRRLKFQQVQVFVLAVGPVDKRLVESMVSYPTEQHVIRVDGYDQLKNAELDLIERMCDAQEGMFDSSEDADYLIGFDGPRAV